MCKTRVGFEKTLSDKKVDLENKSWPNIYLQKDGLENRKTYSYLYFHDNYALNLYENVINYLEMSRDSRTYIID
jgi:hypothetical protein